MTRLALLSLLVSTAFAGAQDSAISPDQTSGLRGLEVLAIVVEDRGGDVGRALADHAEASKLIDERTRRAWDASGLRLIEVPVADLPDLRTKFTLVGAVQRHWFGELTTWRSAQVGTERGTGPITINGASVMLEPGRLALLTRGWVVPRPVDDGPVGAAMQIELTAQNRETRPVLTMDQIEARLRGQLPTLADQGLLFESLTTRLTARDGTVILVVPETPGVDWSTLPPPEDPSPYDEPDTGPTPPEPEEWARPELPEQPEPEPAPSRVGRLWELEARNAGPDLPDAPTLGESLLSRPAQVVESIHGGTMVLHHERKLILILVPHIPEHYGSLLGRRDTDAPGR